MIGHAAFPVEPWQLRETELDLSVLAQTESLFALSNGHVGWRGNLDEGEPHGLPGSYLNGLYERWPLPYAEIGYGNPEFGQTVINVTNGKLIRLLVDDEPFDVRYGTLVSHERVLDFRAGVLRRSAEWVSPAGRRVRVSSTRLVSFAQRAVAAICYEVAPVDEATRVVVQSELVANEQLPVADGDPRAATVLDSPLVGEEHDSSPDGKALLVHRTRRSGLRVAVAMSHVLECPAQILQEEQSWPDVARLTAAATLQPGHRLRLVKFVAFGWSAGRSSSALRDQASGALSSAAQAGWDGVVAEQRAYLDDYWGSADVEIDGDPEIQQAVRFGMFHVLQAGARAERRAIPAKGLTGTGYDGHAFWDTETYVLPVLTLTNARSAADALRWRHETLPAATERARQLGLRGAAFPWRTIHGEECSGYWPAGTAAFHVNADIADAVIRYTHTTGDAEFDAGPGVELLVQTARLWRSLGYLDAEGRFRIDGVTGPDEYSAIMDNNVYTNLLAQQNLRAAADAAARFPERAAELAVTADEPASWREAADAMCVPYDEKRAVHEQAEGYTSHQVWDFADTAADQYPLLRNFPYFDLYRKQVVKQADLVLAMQLRPDAFTEDQKAGNFVYYEPLTVRDSSLSACSQAVIAAEVGCMDLAYDYLAEAALIDIDDLEHNVKDGLHMAALAGSWLAIVSGFGGMRHVNGMFSFAPRLTEPLTRFAFRIRIRGATLAVEVSPDAATYTLAGGPDLDIRHHGSPVTLSAGAPQALPIPALTPLPRPAQPPGREPARRRRPAGGSVRPGGPGAIKRGKP
jgi:alpha,alpha-trehalose phosphorylase